MGFYCASCELERQGHSFEQADWNILLLRVVLIIWYLFLRWLGKLCGGLVFES